MRESQIERERKRERERKKQRKREKFRKGEKQGAEIQTNMWFQGFGKRDKKKGCSKTDSNICCKEFIREYELFFKGENV